MLIFYAQRFLTFAAKIFYVRRCSATLLLLARPNNRAWLLWPSYYELSLISAARQGISQRKAIDEWSDRVFRSIANALFAIRISGVLVST